MLPANCPVGAALRDFLKTEAERVALPNCREVFRFTPILTFPHQGGRDFICPGQLIKWEGIFETGLSHTDLLARIPASHAFGERLLKGRGSRLRGNDGAFPKCSPRNDGPLLKGEVPACAGTTGQSPKLICDSPDFRDRLLRAKHFLYRRFRSWVAHHSS